MPDVWNCAGRWRRAWLRLEPVIVAQICANWSCGSDLRQALLWLVSGSASLRWLWVEFVGAKGRPERPGGVCSGSPPPSTACWAGGPTERAEGREGRMGPTDAESPGELDPLPGAFC